MHMCNNGAGGCGNGQGGCCGGQKMMCGWNHKSIWCWLIGLIVLIIVFCAGYKLGVLRGYFGGYYGMYNGGMYYRGQSGDWRPGMMRGWQFEQQATDQTQPTTTSVKK